MRSATSFRCPEPVSCNLPSTAIRITRTSLTTTPQTRSYIPGRMTIQQVVNGTKSCHRTQRQNLWRYLNSPQGDSREVAWDLMRLAWSSPAALAIAPLQDLLNLGAEARMNVPGRAEGNWSWRCTEELLSTADFHWLRDLTRSSNRLRMLPNPAIEMAEAAL